MHYRGHPVRQARELVNFVTTGKAWLQTPEGEFEWDLWRGQQFTAALLAGYLDEGSSVYAPMRRSARESSSWFRGHRWAVEQNLIGFHMGDYVAAIHDDGSLRDMAVPSACNPET